MASVSLNAAARLNDGNSMPWLGLGVYMSGNNAGAAALTSTWAQQPNLGSFYLNWNSHVTPLMKTYAAQGRTLQVNYQGAEPPPDTFKDDAQALAIGTYGRDGVFHANQLQAKCASKYAPAPGQTTPATTASVRP